MKKFKNIGRRGEEGGSTIGTIATIIIILVVVVVLIVIFTNRTKEGDKYLDALKACQGLGGECVNEEGAANKRDSGYSCFETCGEKNPDGAWCCYKPFE